MKKQAIGLFLALVTGAIALYQAIMIFFPGQSSSTTSSTASSSSEAVTTAASTQAGETTAAASEASTGLTDGTYTGDVVGTNRGDYQVQMTVTGGQIASIDVVLYPSDNERSLTINQNALPTYTAEAISNQSAELTLISGATEAYNGFTGSLQSAISQAQG